MIIVSIYTLYISGMKYIEMELLETDLSHAIQKSCDKFGGLAPERAARYLRHIVSGLTYMHDIMKMIHRDIKPRISLSLVGWRR